MKKITKTLITILITILTFIACDVIFFYYSVYKKTEYVRINQKYTKEKIHLPKYFVKLEKFSNYYNEQINEKRPIMNQNSIEDSIVIFGCSYAYGYIFENQETISYVLSKYSKRPVYNRARNGWSVQHMLYQLQNDNDMFKNTKRPKYVFYVLMNHEAHFYRLHCTNFPDILDNKYYFTYILKNGELIERKPLFNFYYDFSITRHIYNSILEKKIDYYFYKKPNHKLFNFFIQHIEKSNELIKQKWGNDTKFIILTFEHTQRQYWQPQLEEKGIDVIDISETIGIEDLQRKELGFFEPEIAGHPNGKLWELLVPKLKEMYPDL